MYYIHHLLVKSKLDVWFLQIEAPKLKKIHMSRYWNGCDKVLIYSIVIIWSHPNCVLNLLFSKYMKSKEIYNNCDNIILSKEEKLKVFLLGIFLSWFAHGNSKFPLSTKTLDSFAEQTSRNFLKCPISCLFLKSSCGAW